MTGPAIQTDISGLDGASRLGAAIARALAPGLTVALSGDLGAGKTTLARAILASLGHDGETPSPTFTLVQRYDLARFPVFHADLYRLESPEELRELGLDEALAEGALLVEWPERAGPLLPDDRLEVALDAGGEGSRQARLAAHGRFPETKEWL